MTSTTGTRRIVVAAVLLAVAAVIVMLAFRPTSSAMAGMDHSSEAVPASTPTPTMSGDMAGMDHEAPATDHHAPGTGHESGDMPGMDMPASTPTPTMSEDMPGMEHGTGQTPKATPTAPMAEDMPGMDHGSGDAAEPGHGTADTVADLDRPLAPVLGAFGGGTSAVLVTAGLLRRKDRAADRVKQAARAARRGQK